MSLPLFFLHYQQIRINISNCDLVTDTVCLLRMCLCVKTGNGLKAELSDLKTTSVAEQSRVVVYMFILFESTFEVAFISF